jgi:hypothetical protein
MKPSLGQQLLLHSLFGGVERGAPGAMPDIQVHAAIDGGPHL